MSEDEKYPDLCTELHQRTKDVHDKSNKFTNMKLLVALTDVTLYGSVLKDFCFVFQAIEDGLEFLKEKDYISPLRNPMWYRSEQLEKDVAFYLGSDWKAHHQPSPAAKSYLDRISEVIKDDPILLVAYVATIHLGMLAGGQIMKGIVKKTLGLQGDEGTETFAYNNPKHVKTQLRATVNGLNLGREAIEKIFVEKKLVFQMNNAIIANVELTFGSFQRILKFVLLLVLVILLIIMTFRAIF